MDTACSVELSGAAAEILRFRPTIILLCASHISTQELIIISESIMMVECKNILIFSDSALRLEDEIDAELEKYDHGIDVVTTAHQDESIEDIVNYILVNLKFSSCAAKILCIVDNNDPSCALSSALFCKLISMNI